MANEFRVKNGLIVDGDSTLNGKIYDVSGSTGSSGQILSSSPNGVLWISGGTSLTLTPNFDYIDFTTGYTATSKTARVYFDTTEKALSYFPDQSQNVVVRIGQQLYTRVNNITGSDIPKGSVITLQSASNGLPNATLALAQHDTRSQVAGLAADRIPNGGVGLVLNNGLLTGLSANTYNVGDILYLSDTTPGAYVAGTSSFSLAKRGRTNEIGYVVATGTTDGKIYVNINNEDENLSLTDIERNILEGNAISTGIFTYTGMTKTSNTTFQVSPAFGWIVQNTYNYSLQPDVVLVSYSGSTTGQTTPYLTTSDATFVLLTTASTLSFQTTFPTAQQRRENIFLGKVVHPNRSSILNVNNTVDFDVSPMAALRDLWTPIKLVNQGILVTPNGANLNINTSTGALWGNGIGWVTNQQNPNSVSIPSKAPATFAYRTQTGGTTGEVSTIDVGNYDVNGVVTPVPGTQYTTQRIYQFPTGLIRIQYGQTSYTTLAKALAGLTTESFVEFSNTRDNAILIGLLTVVSTATDLSNTSQAVFTLVSKFGEVLTGTAGGLSTTTLQQAYDNSVQPEILTNSTLGAVTFRRGSTSDNDNVIEVQNNSGINTFAVTGQGNLSGNSFNVKTYIYDSLNTSGVTNQVLFTTPSGVRWNNIDSIVTGLTNNKVIELGSGVGSTLRINNSNLSSGNYSGVLSGTGNTASGNYSLIGGGVSNIVTGSTSFIGAGCLNTISSTFSSINGGCNNDIFTDYSFIGGGRSNLVLGLCSVVAGGSTNTASNTFTTIGGGSGNTISSIFSTAAGGVLNTASGNYASIGGGCRNIVGGLYGTIAGGRFNSAGGESSIVLGGQQNAAVFTGGAIAGGCLNTSNNFYVTIAGGCCNSSNGDTATIVGGKCNRSSGNCSTISGGYGNTSSGAHSNVGGGIRNAVSGTCSFIGGGSGHTVSNCFSTIVTGWRNTVSGTYCGIAAVGNSLVGGVGNTINTSFSGVTGINNVGYSFVGGGLSNSNLGTFSTLSGGYLNRTCSVSTTVGGGCGNTASARYSTVVGGHGNTASGNCAVSGGRLNVASQPGAVSFGVFNTASGTYSLVAGGRSSTASGYASAIAGGRQNTTTACCSFVGGGWRNISSGIFSVVGGGCNNLSQGAYSGILGGLSGFTGAYSVVVGGKSNTASGIYSGILGGSGNTINTFNSFIIGSNISANTNNTTFVESLSVTPRLNQQSAINVSGSNTKGGATYIDFLNVVNTNNASFQPGKFFRLNPNSDFEIVNSGYSQTIFTLTEAGNLMVNGATAAGVSNFDGFAGTLMFNNNNSQIYDDGNMHIHTRTAGQAMWINTNGGQLNLLAQPPLLGAARGTGVAIGTGDLIGFVTISSGKTLTTAANYGFLTTGGAGTYGGGSQSVNISLYATQRIWGQEIDAFSDERMKDIKGEISLEDGIKLVKNLKPIKYTWKGGDDKGIKAGYSAQQVSKAGFDHLIGLIPKKGLEETIDDDGFLSPKDTQFSMNYDQVVPYHGTVIKHLLEKIESLEKEITDIKALLNK